MDDDGAMDRAKRVGLRIAMLVVALNVWTGSPLLALWIGSRLQGSGPPKMAPVAAVVVVFAATSFALASVLTRLGDSYDQMTGQVAQVHRHVAWLRSMRGERPQYPGQHVQSTALEKVMIIAVVICVLVFEIWFFFFSTSPIDQRSGRSAAPSACFEPGGGQPYQKEWGLPQCQAPRAVGVLSHGQRPHPDRLDSLAWRGVLHRVDAAGRADARRVPQ